MLSGQEFPVDDWSTRDEEFAFIADRRFVYRVFQTYPSLRLRHPQGGLNNWKPYNGELFDNEVWELVPGGWDHEHCTLCFAKVTDGMSYWANTGSVAILCDYCHDHYAAQLQLPPQTG